MSVATLLSVLILVKMIDPKYRYNHEKNATNASANLKTKRVRFGST
ncbi:hypothetical protein Hanom_Chr03g00184941 [Helianthus anomalus]